jgi:hypothetical protein
VAESTSIWGRQVGETYGQYIQYLKGAVGQLRDETPQPDFSLDALSEENLQEL